MPDIYDKKNKNKHTYFITGGGTGGHIYPAISICEELKKDKDTKEIFYVGNPKNLEAKIAKDKGYEFLSVNISGMPRKFGFGLVKWFFELQIAIIKALYYIYKYKPNAVLGTGGYVSAPALFAANLAGVPFMIHDCDINPGIVSRYVAPMANVVSLAFSGAKEFIKSDKIRINGNPIREAFKTLSKKEARQRLGLEDILTLCVMGGSQGAQSINVAFIEIIQHLRERYDLQIIFQTGKKNWEESIEKLKEVYPEYEQDKRILIKPYFDDMVSVLKSSDIAVSRAGSLSLSEICASGIASVLIPYPHAAADHQRKNAKLMVENRAALYLEDKDVTKDTLLIAIEQILDNPKKLQEIQKNSYSLAKLDATNLILAQLKELV